MTLKNSLNDFWQYYITTTITPSSGEIIIIQTPVRKL